MFREIFSFEIRFRFKKVSTYVYFAMFMAFAFLAIISVGGAFRGNRVVIAGAGEGKILANAPYAIYAIISIFTYFGMLVTAAIMGNAGYRDFQRDMHSFFFSYPVREFEYLMGRFLGAYVVLLFIFSSIGIGAIMGSLMPFVMPEKFASFRLLVYVQPYLTLVLPNLFFSGAVLFFLAAVTRKRLPVYVTCVVLLVSYLIAANLLWSLETRTIASLIDPFGLTTIRYATEYWSVFEKNTLLLPFSGPLLWNRLLWIVIGAVFILLALVRFKFSYYTRDRKGNKGAQQPTIGAETITPGTALPAARRDFSRKAVYRQLLSQIKIEFLGIIRSFYFIIIILLGVSFVFIVGFENIGHRYGTTTFPVTYSVLDLTAGAFLLFMLIVIVFYSGELVWRERDRNVAQIYDSLPIPDWLSFSSKATALILVQALLLSIIMLCGIIIQVIMGYYNFEIGLYLKELFGLRLIEMCWYCILALCVQTVVNNKYFGHFVMVVFYIIIIAMAGFGFEHNLYMFAESPSYVYSDMNGYGHFVASIIWFRIYWTACSLLLVLLTHLLWVRGQETDWKVRLRLFCQRFTRPKQLTAIGFLLIFICSGSYIFYNTNIVNAFETNRSAEEKKAEYEKTYKRYDGAAQPRITSVNTQVDIFAEERRIVITGTYVLQNKSEGPIDTLHIMLHQDPKRFDASFDRAYTMLSSDGEFNYYIYRLTDPLMPHDSLLLTFALEYHERGFKNSKHNPDIVPNGTFINNLDYFPRLGYDRELELVEDDVRKENDLDPRERMAPVDDAGARMNNYVAHDADWITLDAVVSTDQDQIGIASGYLVDEWREGNRRFYRYVMDHKFINLFVFLSGKYEVQRDAWNGVAIEVFYDKAHKYNIDRFIYAIKKSLDYFTTHFGAYQHNLIRIVEFPRYQNFAQSLTATIPYSEGIGFIARIEKDDVDYPFAITAHEVAHQWWAHQVVGANVKGATLMSEVLSQYASLMVYREEYDEKQIHKYLKNELDRYLRQRGNEKLKEVPLMLLENQPYLHYQKGILVMNALQDYIGPLKVNAVLAEYLRTHAYQEPPYTNSIEFLDQLREALPDTLDRMITDMFETITLFENKAVEARCEEIPDGKFQVHLSVRAEKVRADDLGSEEEIPIHDWIDIGLLGEDDEEIYLKKHLIDEPDMEFTIVVNEKPMRAGIDPYHKLIDRLIADNVVKVIHQ